MTGSIKKGKMRRLDENLWLLGNTSIAHSKKLAGGDYNPFAVIFDPAEVDEALDIPTEDVNIEVNTLFPGLAEAEPSRVICFPFAQHYIADSPGCRTIVKDRNELIAKYNEMTESGISKTFSANTIIREVSLAIAVSILIVVILFIVL